MAIKKGIPAVQKAITNTLNANIAAEVAAVASAWGTTLATPTVINGYREVIPQYPAIVVSWLDSGVKADASSQWQNLDHIYEIAIICQALDLATLDQQIQYYMTAIWEVCIKYPQLDGSLSGCIGLGLTRAGRSDVYKDKTATRLMQAAAWHGIVAMDESA